VFDPAGKYLREFGKKGSGPGEFDQPHGLAFDSKGRLFVADRSNNRIQILDQDGRFLEEWHQFSRPSGIYIDKNDMIYVADSESGSVGNGRSRTEWKRGIRIGSLKDGKVTALIPDPNEKATNTSAAEGVAVDGAGNIYGAEVGPRALKKYVRSGS
jgi:sugar lactone lactonase YvrE